MKEKVDKESYFIKQFIDSKYIGDDGAVIDNIVYNMDAFFENVHFKREWMSLEQIASKAMLVNISDAIVMNAQPKYALLSVAIPKEFSKKELEELALGFRKVAEEFDMEIIGGDTISNEKLDISVTIISETLKPVYRKGIQEDQLICYTGDLGSVKKDLASLLEGKSISKDSKFIKPQLKQKFFYEIASYTTSAMDISDGLFFELERLSELNNIGFEFEKEFLQEVGCSGEEYEILFSIEKKDKEIVEQIAKKHQIELNFFAKAVKGSFESPCKSHHFG
jgi:thiamine-monophosphate kinase